MVSEKKVKSSKKLEDINPNTIKSIEKETEIIKKEDPVLVQKLKEDEKTKIEQNVIPESMIDINQTIKDSINPSSPPAKTNFLDLKGDELEKVEFQGGKINKSCPPGF